MGAETRTRYLATSQRAMKRNAETEIGQPPPPASRSFAPKFGYLLQLILNIGEVVPDYIRALVYQKACAAGRAGMPLAFFSSQSYVLIRFEAG